MKLTIIIPVYNESKTVVEILRKIEKTVLIKKQLIIVNDCSSDNSLELLKTFNFISEHRIINHPKNMGKGACIKSAKKFIKGEFVLIQDADLEYNPMDYYKMLDSIIKMNAKALYGSRFLGANNNKNFTSIFRIFANKALTCFSNFINRQKLTDAHTCYKLVRSDIFKSIKFEENGFAFCVELTTKLSNKKVVIKEVPINYLGRSYDEGKKIKLRDGAEAIFSILKYKFLFK